MNETDPAATVDTLLMVAAELRGMGPRLRLSAREINGEAWGDLGDRFREVMNAAAMASENIGADVADLAEDYRIHVGAAQPSVLRRPLTYSPEDAQ